MVKHARGFEEFVRARLPHLARLSRGLTGDDKAGVGLLQESLSLARARWRPNSPETAEDDVRRDLVRRALHHKAHGLVHTDREESRAIWSALSARTPRQRAVLTLLLLDEVSIEDAADILRCTPAIVRDERDETLQGLDRQQVRQALEAPAEVDQSSILAAVRTIVARRTRRHQIALAGIGAAVCTGIALVGPKVTPHDAQPPRTGLTDPVTAYAATDASHLWAITRVVGCPNCSTLWKGDGTATGWSKLYDFDQPPLVSEIRMAPGGKDGWVWFGIDWLQATHDGGRTWVIPGGELRNALGDVQVAGKTVYALPGANRLFAAPVGTDEWTEVDTLSLPGAVVGLVPFQDRMYLAAPGRHTTLIDPGTGSPHRIKPCPGQARPLRSTPRSLFALCLDDRGSSTWLLRSTDGASWDRLDLPPDAHDGMAPINDESVFVPASDGAQIVTPQGFVDVQIELRQSERIEETTFVTDQIGFLLTTRGRLQRSDDAGRSWAVVG